MKITERKLRSIIRSVITENRFEDALAAARRDKRHADADAKTIELNKSPMRSDNILEFPDYDEIMSMDELSISQLTPKQREKCITVLEDSRDIFPEKKDSINAKLKVFENINFTNY
jgi:hypothetical protein